MGIEHFGCKYGDKLNNTSSVEFAPKFEYDKLEDENRKLRDEYQPMTYEHRDLKVEFKSLSITYNKLKSNVQTKNDMKKRY